MGLLSYNWYYPGIVLTIFNRKQFIYNISTITCKSHGARSTCVTAITCVKMINCVWTYVPQLNLSIYILYLYIKAGREQKAHIFNLSAERILTWSVSECFNICADQNSEICFCVHSTALLPRCLEENDGAEENNHLPLILLLLLFVWRHQSALGILTDNVFIN